MRYWWLCLMLGCSFPEKQLVTGDGSVDGAAARDAAIDAKLITVTGITRFWASANPVAGALLDVQTSTGSSLTTTTSDSAGNFTISLTGGAMPIQAHLKATKTSVALDSYAYPTHGIDRDFAGLLIYLPTSATMMAVGNSFTPTSVAWDSTKASYLLSVVDSNSNAVVGATITASPSGTVAYYTSSGTFSTTAGATDSTGTAVVYNVNPGVANTMVTANKTGFQFVPLVLASGAIGGAFYEILIQP